MPCVSSCVSSGPMLLLMTSMSTGSDRLHSAMTAPEALPRARAAARPRLQERFKNEVSAGAEGDWAEKLRVVLAERDTPLELMLMRGAAAAAMERTMPSLGNMRQRSGDKKQKFEVLSLGNCWGG